MGIGASADGHTFSSIASGKEGHRNGSFDLPLQDSSSDHGNLHAIISMNAHAQRVRKEHVEVTQRVHGGFVSSKVPNSLQPLADPYEGYDIPTLRSIYGVSMNYGEKENHMSATVEEEGFYSEGLRLLAPLDNIDEIQDGTPRDSAVINTKDTSASRLSAYSFWMTDLDHQMRIRRLFDHIERALLLYYDRLSHAMGSSGVWHVVTDMRTPDALVANGFISNMSIEDNDQGATNTKRSFYWHHFKWYDKLRLYRRLFRSHG